MIKRLALLILTTAALHAADFTGSEKCQPCHSAVYAKWKKTRMANILVDVKAHPEAILGDFSKPDPLVTFRKEDIVFTYGSKWKQRYFTKVGNDYFVYGAQWDVTAKVWRKYYAKDGTDWWTAHYPAEQMQRPTGPLCDGCHSTNFNVNTNAVTEWNVGCERCHGAGSKHVKKPSKTNIVNAARLDYVRANDICIQCHSQGQPKTNPVNGKYYDWPTTYKPGDRLSDHWNLEEHKLGETSFTHFPDGTAHKNRMQGNDYVQSAMYTHGIKCSNCHDVHGTANAGDTIKAGNALCLQCHGGKSPNGPRGGSIEAHTHHKAGSTGSECTACHMPRIEQTIDVVNVRAHTFKFITPSQSEREKIPNACILCHKDKTNQWATGELDKWPNVSPWRMK